MVLDTVIVPRPRDLTDGLQVRRALPDAKRRAVGPFVFFDHMGPAAFAPGQGMDVRPHPHIGLATVTYLFEGEILHRDSLATVQPIRPGEVNWMTAGKGIVHSERTPGELRASGSRISGIQTWVALPQEQEECEPSFFHADADLLPIADEGGCRLRLILGTLAGLRSPVPVSSPMFYADAALAPGARLLLPAEHEERAAYIISGDLEAGPAHHEAGALLVFAAGGALPLHAPRGARLLVFGGMPLGMRHMWWNFVSSRKERIEQAARDWKAGRFATVPEETDFIPLPARAPGVVDYP